MNCNCCSILSSTATVAIDSGNTFILISPSEALSPENEDRVKIKIVNSVPTAGATLPVAITFGSSNVYTFLVCLCYILFDILYLLFVLRCRIVF